ncbi:MAG: phosphotransferase family protein [Streptosporangiaceae bacterium]
MAQHYGPRAGGLRALGSGEWSRAYALALDGREYVIRFGGHVEDFRKDAVLAEHSSARLAIPSVTEIGQAGDGYFAVSERASGRLLDQIDGTEMRRVLPALLATLDAIAAVEVPGGQGYGIWAPDGVAPAMSWAQALLAVDQETARVPGWLAALAASPTGAAPFGRAYGRLADLVSGLEVPRQLIHGDLLNRNVLVRGDQVAAVIDWGNAMFGDAVYDAAWLIYWWPWYPRFQGIDVTAELRNHWAERGVLPEDLDRRLTACLLHIGLDAMSYNAFRGRWDDLARNASQLAALA